MNDRPESHFASDRHCLYAGWVLGLAAKHHLPVVPVVDEDGNYVPELSLTLAEPGFAVEATITLVIPEPPDDWTLE